MLPADAAAARPVLPLFGVQGRGRAVCHTEGGPRAVGHHLAAQAAQPPQAHLGRAQQARRAFLPAAPLGRPCSREGACLEGPCQRLQPLGHCVGSGSAPLAATGDTRNYHRRRPCPAPSPCAPCSHATGEKGAGKEAEGFEGCASFFPPNTFGGGRTGRGGMNPGATAGQLCCPKRACLPPRAPPATPRSCGQMPACSVPPCPLGSPAPFLQPHHVLCHPHPNPTPPGWELLSGKFAVLAGLLGLLRSCTRDRIVVVSNYTQTLDLVAQVRWWGEAVVGWWRWWCVCVWWVGWGRDYVGRVVGCVRVGRMAGCGGVRWRAGCSTSASKPRPGRRRCGPAHQHHACGAAPTPRPWRSAAAVPRPRLPVCAPGRHHLHQEEEQAGGVGWGGVGWACGIHAPSVALPSSVLETRAAAQHSGPDVALCILMIWR